MKSSCSRVRHRTSCEYGRQCSHWFRYCCLASRSINPPLCPTPTLRSPTILNGFVISLSGQQGQIVGGMVASGLIAARTMFVIVASFNNPNLCVREQFKQFLAAYEVCGGK
ncbi:hypothetical protein DEO72_LG2g676 [Vigna unguiculata]|uniref:Uncharacterized protein n=1 Tax=Vigna unguiculata TaxID=3917 RepID=A0A4D6KVE0_VIGUN|nr:hypothetical protein DEO72_LG2g676 [Vigna unguiculata]